MRHWLLLCFALTGCPATDDQVVNTLTNMGFSAVVKGDPVLWGCSRGEIGSHFTATNPHGSRVAGLVCCGGYLPLNKGCTVRF
jgi:hypothetical protein